MWAPSGTAYRQSLLQDLSVRSQNSSVFLHTTTLGLTKKTRHWQSSCMTRQCAPSLKVVDTSSKDVDTHARTPPPPSPTTHTHARAQVALINA